MVKSNYIQYDSIAYRDNDIMGKSTSAPRNSDAELSSRTYLQTAASRCVICILKYYLPIILFLLFVIYQLAVHQLEPILKSAIVQDTAALIPQDISTDAQVYYNKDWGSTYEPASGTEVERKIALAIQDTLQRQIAALNQVPLSDEKHYLFSPSGNLYELSTELKLSPAQDLKHITSSATSALSQIITQTALGKSPTLLPESFELQQQTHIAVGMLIMPMQWKYVRLIPTASLHCPIWQLLWKWTLALALVSLFTVVVFEYVFHRNISLRLKHIHDAIKRLSLGDTRARADCVGNDEIAEIAQAFNSMANNFECDKEIESILNQLEHDYLDGKKTKPLLDDVCRKISHITHLPLVWVALSHEEKLSLHGVGGSDTLMLRNCETYALNFCNEALKNRVQSSTHKGEAPFPGAPVGQSAIFPLTLKHQTTGAIVFHAPSKHGFVAEHWNAMRYWAGRLQHTLHVMENEREMLDVRLRMLQAQIEPHFLVNTLSNIITQVKSRPNIAKQMLSLLASYLRVSLTRTRGRRTTLREELEVLSVYLQIQSFRMPNRLTHKITCDDSLLELKFPPLLLQPLVENAVQHGIEPAIEGGSVEIEISVSGDKLVLKVADTGIGLVNKNKKNLPHRGVGITNIRNRLSGLYGQSANLKITQNEPGGVLALMEIPLKSMESI